ncbi:hypothetical protein C8J57DRAFT_1246604 [Mycena rebaudengoi]|nr:hypothetical protein C8J57DRAFT_1246604 [Mycena rebaudengoi]
MLKAFFSSAAARVYNLRVLLVVTAATIGYNAHIVIDAITDGQLVVAFITIRVLPQCLILSHHLCSLFVFRFGFTSVVDWVVTLIELFAVIWYMVVTEGDTSEKMFQSAFLICQLATFLLSLIFRTVAIAATKTARYRQPFKLLGGCNPTRVPYTPVRIIFGTSLVRPLVRGEVPAIAFIRGLILVVLCIGLPAFSIYTAIFIPLQSQVLIRNVKYDGISLNSPQRPHASITILKIDPFWASHVPMNAISVSGNRADQAVPLSCNRSEFPYLKSYASGASDGGSFRAQFTDKLLHWNDVGDIVVIVNFTEFAPDEIIYVASGQGDPTDITDYTPQIQLRRKTVIVNDPLLVQPDPLPPDSSLGIATLRIRQKAAYEVTKSTQEYTENSILTGLATVGGFWTFVNGAFVLFFGANIIYFLFRRRPLSALGIVHIFQRASLAKKWRQDFPAIRTEGGQPGSREAGIVAFLRERLVDLDEEESEAEDTPGDIEAQPSSGHMVVKDENSTNSNESRPMVNEEELEKTSDEGASSEERESLGGYGLAEIPSIDLNLEVLPEQSPRENL